MRAFVLALVLAASLSEARIHGNPAAAAPVENHKNAVKIAGPRQPPAAEQKKTIVVAKKVVAQAALKAEVRSLFAAMRQKTADIEPFEKFMPRCLEHTKNLLTVVDRSYTD